MPPLQGSSWSQILKAVTHQCNNTHDTSAQQNFNMLQTKVTTISLQHIQNLVNRWKLQTSYTIALQNYKPHTQKLQTYAESQRDSPYHLPPPPPPPPPPQKKKKKKMISTKNIFINTKLQTHKVSSNIFCQLQRTNRKCKTATLKRHVKFPHISCPSRKGQSQPQYRNFRQKLRHKRLCQLPPSWHQMMMPCER